MTTLSARFFFPKTSQNSGGSNSPTLINPTPFVISLAKAAKSAGIQGVSILALIHPQGAIFASTVLFSATEDQKADRMAHGSRQANKKPLD